MSCYLRPKVSGLPVFFTVCLAVRGSDLLVREVARLREAVRLTREEHPFEIEAMVVLPDHLHAIWTLPEGDRAYGTRWGAIKSRFSRSVMKARRKGRVGFYPTAPRSPSKTRKGDAGIWQRRFWEHHIRDAADLEAHLAYCWGNPVRHGLVDRAVDWPFSSLHREIRAGRVGSEWTGGEIAGDFGEWWGETPPYGAQPLRPVEVSAIP